MHTWVHWLLDVRHCSVNGLSVPSVSDSIFHDVIVNELMFFLQQEIYSWYIEQFLWYKVTVSEPRLNGLCTLIDTFSSVA